MITCRQMTGVDIDFMVHWRTKVLLEANGLPDGTDMSLVEHASRQYYEKALETGDHIALAAFEGEQFAGCGGVSFYTVMPTYYNPAGLCAYIMNMYTPPPFRRQGIALKLLDLLVQKARGKGAGRILLEATDMGRPLYERYGFVQADSEMELPL